MVKKSDLQVSYLIIIYEFLLGLVEVILGLGILIIGDNVVLAYQALQHSDFLSERNDLLADILDSVIPYLTTHKLGISLLLLAFGAVKISSAIGLWLKKEWGKHLLVGLLVVLIPFDLFGLVTHPDIFEVGYLVIDVLIILYLIEFSPKEYLEDLKRLFRKGSF